MPSSPPTSTTRHSQTKQTSPTHKPETVNRSRTGNSPILLPAGLFFSMVRLPRPNHQSPITNHKCLLSSFYADNLLDPGHDFDQVRRLLEDLGDRLVGARDLVHDARVLPALDALGLTGQVSLREPPPGLAPRHEAPGSVRRALERLEVAETP